MSEDFDKLKAQKDAIMGRSVFSRVDHETVIRLVNIATAVRMARAYGHGATPHQAEHVIARKDAHLDQAIKWLAELGLGGSVLREDGDR